jgi:acyl carrier protein
MSQVTLDEVREFLATYLSQKLAAQGRTLPDDFCDESDLLLSGMIDSLGILELVTALSEFVGQEIDFEALDPEKMTVVGPLCEFVVTSGSGRVS